MKYKVGDKVRVRFDLKEGHMYGGVLCYYYMKEKAGTILTIRNICEHGEMLLSEENDIWWPFDMVEPVNKTFTKSDLKTGMTVVQRNGETKLVLLDTPLGDNLVGDNWVSLDDYSDDLKFTAYDNTCIDIIEVYEPLYNHLLMPRFLNQLGDNGKYKLVWKREEVLEVTMDEIAEKFKVNVNNIKIKKQPLCR